MRKTGARLLSLPRKFDPEFKLEGVDCSRMKMVYVGLDNLGKCSKISNTKKERTT